MTTPGAPAILLLGGTEEATELARELTVRGADVVLSFAGLTKATTMAEGKDLLPYRVRIGGFGGVPGLVDELRQGGYGLLIDATHPFSTRMARNAAAGAHLAGIDHLRLLRPPWQAVPDDVWYEVDDLPAAAARLAELGVRRAFLSIGRQGLGSFTDLRDVQLVVRSVEPPLSLPEGVTVLLGRGPFTVDAEIALFREHRIEAVVARNSGARATEAKLEAARRLDLPVVMMRRPEGLPCEQATTVTETLDWVEARELLPATPARLR